MRKRYMAALALAFFFAARSGAEAIRARWSLEADEAIVGQGLGLTVEIQGTDSVNPPDFSVPGVAVSFQGGGPRNSTSIVTVNGKTTRTESKAWVGSWTLKALSVGTYRVGPQTWNVAGSTISLPALAWRVVEAQTDPRFTLRQNLSQSICVPGIEVEYTLTWYIGEAAQNPEFTIPILDDPNLVPVEASFAAPSGDSFQIQYNGRVITGIKSNERLNGKDYTALTIRFRVKPSAPGIYDLSGTMVSFEGAVDSQQVQDFFGNIVSQPLYKSLVARANGASLSVRELPASGKPNPFSGLIGKLALSWDASQGEYRVGEPIRLTLALTGVLNKPNLDLDHMVTEALDGSDFQVSADLAAKESEGRRSFIFRARRAGKLTIPPLSLNYYDPETGRYGETSTKALTFTVMGSSALVAPSAAQNRAASPSTQAVGAEGQSRAPEDGWLDGARMNPNGLSRSAFFSIPWWTFGLPGAVSALAIGALAKYLRSKRRLLARARKAWKASLGPLGSASEDGRGGRAALEEGRARLQRLGEAGGAWKARLESDGRWERLRALEAEWDEAFFAKDRNDEAWAERWDAARREMGAWT